MAVNKLHLALSVKKSRQLHVADWSYHHHSLFLSSRTLSLSLSLCVSVCVIHVFYRITVDLRSHKAAWFKADSHWKC